MIKDIFIRTFSYQIIRLLQRNTKQYFKRKNIAKAFKTLYGRILHRWSGVGPSQIMIINV